MQRAAASNPPSPSPSQSQSQLPSTPTSERPSKRQRLSTASVATPVTPIDPGEVRQQQAIDRAAAEAGETKWVLSLQQSPLTTTNTHTPIKVVTAGYGTIDNVSNAHLPVKDSDSEPEHPSSTRPSIHGRRSFGKFNKTLEKQQNPDLSSSEPESDKDEDDSEDDSEDDHDDPLSAMVKQQRKEAADKIRKERKAKEKADKADAERMAKERRMKGIKLNIPNGQGISTGGQNLSLANVACFLCGETGHVKVDCPKRQRRAWEKQPAMEMHH